MDYMSAFSSTAEPILNLWMIGSSPINAPESQLELNDKVSSSMADQPI